MTTDIYQLLLPFLDSKNKFSSQRIRYAKKEIIDPVVEATSFLNETNVSLLFRLFCLRDKITEIPKCGFCSKPLLDIGSENKIKQFCNSTCYSQTQKFRDSLKTVDQDKAKIKRKSTMIEKYGVEFNSQRDEVKPILQRSKLINVKPEALVILEDKERMVDLHITQKLTSVQIGILLAVHNSTVIDYIRNHGIEYHYYHCSSKYENLIEGLLQPLLIDYKRNQKKIIPKYDLDFLIPSHNLAIEVNGIYRHSESCGRDANYHIFKTVECEKINIELLHFWDSEIGNKLAIVESMIHSKLGLNKTIGARKCKVKEISVKEANDFFEATHLQGSCSASFAVGLFFQDELVSAASFSKPRFAKNYDLELIRFSSQLKTTIVGGLSKVLKNIKGTIISYANRRFSQGAAYLSCGFEFSHSTKPSYCYSKDGMKLESRIKYQKHKLTEMPFYSPDLSELEIMNLNGLLLKTNTQTNFYSRIFINYFGFNLHLSPCHCINLPLEKNLLQCGHSIFGFDSLLNRGFNLQLSPCQVA